MTDTRLPFLWFDLDDTLWDMTGNSTEVLSDLYHTDPDINGAFLPKGLGHWLDTYHSVNTSLWEEYNRAEITREYLRIERFARPLRMAGVGSERADSISKRLDGEYLDRLGRKQRLVAGAAQMLETAAALGFRMGIVSNGFSEVQFNKLRSGGIDGYFNPVVLSDETGINKPDLRFFRHAEKRAGVTASECLIIGDNPDTDIAGGVNAGWKAVWFNPGHKSAAPPESPACVAECQSCAEIENYLISLAKSES